MHLVVTHPEFCLHELQGIRKRRGNRFRDRTDGKENPCRRRRTTEGHIDSSLDALVCHKLNCGIHD